MTENNIENKLKYLEVPLFYNIMGEITAPIPIVSIDYANILTEPHLEKMIKRRDDFFSFKFEYWAFGSTPENFLRFEDSGTVRDDAIQLIMILQKYLGKKSDLDGG